MVGGEFEIDLSFQRDFVPQSGTFYYASGRAALYQILLTLVPQHKIVWMPDWLCFSMVEAAEQAGLKVQFYELDIQFKTSIDALDHSGFRDGDVVLMVNYFGLQDLTSTAKAVKEAYPDAIVIEDDVQAYWSFAEKENPYADYRFTSMRKAFAIPDGGLVMTTRPMPEATCSNTFAPLKVKAGVMKQHRGEAGIKDEDYLALFKKGDELIGDNYESRMSNDSQRLFAGTDFEQAKCQRQANARVIIEGLSRLGIEPLIEVPADCVPLFIPICLENRDNVRRRMFRHEVFCPVHWPVEGLSVKTGKEMAGHELSLIVDQRYSHDDMDILLYLLK